MAVSTLSFGVSMLLMSSSDRSSFSLVSPAGLAAPSLSPSATQKLSFPSAIPFVVCYLILCQYFHPAHSLWRMPAAASVSICCWAVAIWVRGACSWGCHGYHFTSVDICASSIVNAGEATYLVSVPPFSPATAVSSSPVRFGSCSAAYPLCSSSSSEDSFALWLRYRLSARRVSSSFSAARVQIAAFQITEISSWDRVCSSPTANCSSLFYMYGSSALLFSTAFSALCPTTVSYLAFNLST